MIPPSSFPAASPAKACFALAFCLLVLAAAALGSPSVEVPGAIVPRYVFDHPNLLFLALGDGLVVCHNSEDGQERWRLETGGPMIRTQINQLPKLDGSSGPSQLTHPFGVRGQWLYTRGAAGYEEAPFAHITQLLHNPLFTAEDGTELLTTSSATRFDVNERGVISTAGLVPMSETSPVVHIVRFDVHIAARRRADFDWNMTISTVTITVGLPDDWNGAGGRFADELRQRPFKESGDRGRGHVEVDGSLQASWVVGGRMQWSKAVATEPVAAFAWTGHNVINVDLLGADRRRLFQLALPTSTLPPSVMSVDADGAAVSIRQMLSVVGTTPSNGNTVVLEPTRATSGPVSSFERDSGAMLVSHISAAAARSADLDGGERLSQPVAAQDGQWLTISRMHSFVIISLLLYVVAFLSLVTAISQRNRLRQAWGQLDELQSAFREQQRARNGASQPTSLKLGPSTDTLPISPLTRSATDLGQFGDDEWVQEDSSNHWELPAAQSPTTSRNASVAVAPAASLFNMHFNIIRRIGSGGGGMVFEARHRLTEATYAIKLIALKGDESRITREAVLHSKLEHRNVVRFFYCWIEELPPETLAFLSSFDGNDDESERSASTAASQPSNPGTPTSSDGGNPKFVFIQMEFFKNGTLAEFLATPHRKVNREENLSLLLMIVRGLEYLHGCGVVHRDLKPTNIFLTDDFVAKIGDFGLSYTNQNGRQTAELVEPAYATEGNETFGVGSPLYSSPEQLDSGKATSASDVYALGVLALEMYHNFTTQHERIDTLQALRNGTIDPQLTKRFPEEVQMVRRMTVAHPRQRATLREVHDCLRKLLKSIRSPEVRPAPDDVT